MTTTTLYKSTDASAPTLNGTAGSLIAVLDACLVNGYGAKAAAGWAKSFSGTNKAGYRAPLGTRFYLRVLDDGTDATNGAKVAMIRGYETMSDVDTGTGDFPTVAQAASGLFLGKSSTADSTARPWFVLADEKRVLIATAYLSTLTEAYAHAIFGDVVGASAADAYASMIFGSTTSANAVGSTVGGTSATGNIAVSPSTSGLYAARAANGGGASIAQINMFPCTQANGSGVSTLPSGPDGAGNVWADHIQLCDGASSASAAPRGHVPWVKWLRNYLPYATYPSFHAFGDHLVVRYYATHAQAYLIDTGNLE